MIALGLNLCRPKSTAGKCFSFRSRVKFCQEPARGFFHRLFFPPVPLLSAAHDEQHAARSIVNGQTSVGEFRNVVR